MTAVEQILERIEHGCQAGLLPRDWEQLAMAARAEMQFAWWPEPVFRERTGKGVEWCRTHFAKYTALGQAKLEGRRRYWREDAVPSRHPKDIEDDVVRSFR